MSSTGRDAADDHSLQGTVEIYSRDQLAQCGRWATAFATQRKDHRYYELVEDTIQEFEYRYFVIKDSNGRVCAIQPFFTLDQDILTGSRVRTSVLVRLVRRIRPRFMRIRTMMVGCAAGEGHLDDADDSSHQLHAALLAASIVRHARELRAPLIVLKEFPAKYRPVLECFLRNGFVRVPSLPMTRLNIAYASFDEYMRRALNSATRAKLRRKFRAAASAPPIEMKVVHDVSPIIDEIYPLYLSVYDRSKLRFEKLTKEYFCGLGRLMPDKVRFFLWRQAGSVVAFTACMIQGREFYAEYLGLDYAVALDLHLYHYAVRDMISWAIANGYKQFRSSALNYDPKLHLRHLLDPVDLYVRHTSVVWNTLLRWALPLLEPTRRDQTLPKFANYSELWGNSSDVSREGTRLR
jgi:hypothetical protein